MSATGRTTHRVNARGSRQHEQLLRDEAAAAHASTERPVIDCPRCVKGSVTVRDGSMSWQVRKLRCSNCAGTGRVYAEEPGR